MPPSVVLSSAVVRGHWVRVGAGAAGGASGGRALALGNVRARVRAAVTGESYECAAKRAGDFNGVSGGAAGGPAVAIAGGGRVATPVVLQGSHRFTGSEVFIDAAVARAGDTRESGAT